MIRTRDELHSCRRLSRERLDTSCVRFHDDDGRVAFPVGFDSCEAEGCRMMSIKGTHLQQLYALSTAGI